MKMYLKILVAVILLTASVMSCTSCLGPILGLFGEKDSEAESNLDSDIGENTESLTESETATEGESADESESDTESEAVSETETESESEIYVDLTNAPEKYGISSADITAMRSLKLFCIRQEKPCSPSSERTDISAHIKTL